MVGATRGSITTGVEETTGLAALAMGTVAGRAGAALVFCPSAGFRAYGEPTSAGINGRAFAGGALAAGLLGTAGRHGIAAGIVGAVLTLA